MVQNRMRQEELSKYDTGEIASPENNKLKIPQ